MCSTTRQSCKVALEFVREPLHKCCLSASVLLDDAGDQHDALKVCTGPSMYNTSTILWWCEVVCSQAAAAAHILAVGVGLAAALCLLVWCIYLV